MPRQNAQTETPFVEPARQPADACSEVACRLTVLRGLIEECSELPAGEDLTGGYEFAIIEEALDRCIWILRTATNEKGRA